MNRIQELIDERRADMPVGLAKELLELCQQESAEDRLYHVTTVRIIAINYKDDDEPLCELKPIKQHHTLLAKSRKSHPEYVSEQEWLDLGFIDESLIDAELPKVLLTCDNCITIVHEVKRRACKRAR